MTTDTEPELQQNPLQSQLETTKKELAESQKKLAESQEKLQRFQNNVAPWWPRFLFAILVAGTIVWLTANRLLYIEVKTWLDLTSIVVILVAWCSTSWAAFWYTRTLR